MLFVLFLAADQLSLIIQFQILFKREEFWNKTNLGWLKLFHNQLFVPGQDSIPTPPASIDERQRAYMTGVFGCILHNFHGD